MSCECKLRMTNQCPAWRLGTALWLWLGVCGSPFASEDPKVARAQIEAHAASRTAAFQPPERISKRDARTNEVVAPLDVRFAVVNVERPVKAADGRIVTQTDPVLVRTYNGKMIVPEVRVKAGDILRMPMMNSLPKPTKPDEPSNTKPNGFYITNLHTHGLHVSPNGYSDNVLHHVNPTESFPYCFDIPACHVAGTMWFHAHRHGSAAIQLSSGMAGALIVDPGPNGGIDDIPEIAAAMKDGREKILVFQQLRYSMRDDGLGEVNCKDIFGKGDGGPDDPCPHDASPKGHQVMLVNGVYAPVIHMRPGEVQRWRCIHGGIIQEINLKIEGSETIELHEIAKDGLPSTCMEPRPSILLYPGYRTDFLLKAPMKSGEYRLVHAPGSTVRKLRPKQPNAFTTDLLARVCVSGEPLPMILPHKDAIKKYALKPVEDWEIANKQPITIDLKAASGRFTINDKVFDETKPPEMFLKVGTAEEWTLKSTQEFHPFHVHVNPFEVVEKDGKGAIVKRFWKDTVFVGEDDARPVLVRTRFEHFAGRTVLHCHNLDHEDRGMMKLIELQGQDTLPNRCPAPPSVGGVKVGERAPTWILFDAKKTTFDSTQMDGRRSLLVFVRGLGCTHCRQQLDAIAAQERILRERDLTVVVISPDDGGLIRTVLDSEDGKALRRFTVLSDDSLETFRRFGCHREGRVLHGLFAIGSSGVVDWKAVGDEPEANLERALQASK
jgi:FtsP/CotA-like multicopper oxidase with cupredoxin domain/peroxiredoxin